MGLEDRRKGAVKKVPRKLSEEEQRQIVDTCCSPSYRNLTPYEIVPKLAAEGRYIGSEASFYRVLRVHDLLKDRRERSAARRPEPLEVKARAANQLWSWDITYLKTKIRGRYFYLYLFMDVFCRSIMGWDVFEREDGQLAAGLFKSAVERYGARGVRLHSDNGGPMRSATMLATLQRLGVVPSFSRPSVSNDNPFSESLFKTLKYRSGYPRSFESIEAARDWVAEFVEWYNEEHLHSQIGYVTPMQRYRGEDLAILAERQATYQRARAAHPERWSRSSRAWTRPSDVFLKRSNQRTTKDAA